MKPLTVLSLFDGMSCGQLALQRAGIPVKQYFASEIDKHAIKVTQANFPDTVQLGDVKNVKASDLPQIDLLIGGSPCQGFSLAGKRLNFSDPRSALFFEYLRLKNELQPRYFLLENVVMAEDIRIEITRLIGANCIQINSALLSAQNRVRLYWTNIGAQPQGLFGFEDCAIPQPKDKGILLKHILQHQVEEKYYLSDKMLNYLNTRKDNFNNGKINYKEKESKASCINASSGHIDISDNIIIEKNGFVNNQGKHILKEKSNCIDANYSKGLDSHGQRTFINERQVKQINPSKECNGQQPHYQNRVYCTSGISPALNTYTPDLLIKEANPNKYVAIKPGVCFDYQHPTSSTRRGRKMEEKTNCLQENNSFLNYTSDQRIRRLTPVECERLQTVIDNYTNHVSDTQRYRMLGNGWTVDVVAHIFNHII